MNLRTTAALSLASVLGLAAACGEGGGADDPTYSPTPPAAEDGGQVTSSPDAALTNPSLCTELALGGDVVVEVERIGRAAEPVGGDVLEGTYDLTEVTTFIAANPDCADSGPPDPEMSGEPENDCPRVRRTNRVAQATLVVTKYAIQRIGATGEETVGAPGVSAAVYEVDGTSLATTTLCPTGGTKGKTGYSASGAALALLVDGKEEMFVRRP